MQRPVQLDHITGAGFLVQTIHVLRDKSFQMLGTVLTTLQGRQRKMGRVGLGGQDRREAQKGASPVPVAGLIRVSEGLVKDGLVIWVKGVSAVLATVVWDGRVGGDACAGEGYEAARVGVDKVGKRLCGYGEGL